jgi:hypothetical protein
MISVKRGMEINDKQTIIISDEDCDSLATPMLPRDPRSNIFPQHKINDEFLGM